MPQHKTNPTAVMNSMLPALLPHGHQVGSTFHVAVVPAAGVLLYPAEHMRKTESGFEIQNFPSEEWVPAPQGVRVVHPIGQTLPAELCDVVVMFGTVVQDTLGRRIVTAPGQQERYKTSNVMHGELARIPLLQWQEQHMQQLRGQVV